MKKSGCLYDVIDTSDDCFWSVEVPKYAFYHNNREKRRSDDNIFENKRGLRAEANHHAKRV